MSDNDHLTIFCQNMNVNRYLTSLMTSFNDYQLPDVIVLTESWLDDVTPVIVPGFVVYSTVRPGRSGGVSILVKKSLKSIKIDEHSYVNDTIELCTIKIYNNRNHIILSGIYRPHSDSINNFTNALDNLLNCNIFRNNSCVLIGDFNIDMLLNSNNVLNFVETMRTHHFLQSITDITHPGIIGRNSNASLIDHIWMNRLSTYSSCTVRTGLSDHYGIYVQLPFFSSKASSKKLKLNFRDCCEVNQITFREKLQNFNWMSIKSEDTNVYTRNFVSTLNTLYCESFPMKTKIVTEKYFLNPWYTPEIRRLSAARFKYHALYNENLISLEEYAYFRNRVTSLIRNFKQSYFRRCFERNVGNIKATWKLIKKLSKNNHNLDIDTIFHDGISYDNKSEIADIFNQYFVSVAEDLARNLPSTQLSPYVFIERNRQNIVIDPVTEDECSTIIKSLKRTKQDIDFISVEIFQKFHELFLKYLCELINHSFIKGVFPDEFKHATVIPVWKKGSRTIVSNFRPISILPFIGKIFEKCMYNRIISFVSNCNLISPNQFGFTKGRTTQDAIFLLTEKIYRCWNDNDSSFILNIFVDFRKCFDTINHQIMLKKLELYGINGIFLKLLTCYLTNRSQSVRISNTISSARPITVGTPQGSNLSCLLFLLFINELPRISNRFSSILFADDLTMVFRCNESNAEQVCNSELAKFLDWTTANKLSVNIDKTYCIAHTYRIINTNNFNIFIDNSNLQFYEEGLFLGITIDSKMKFIKHIDNVCNKLSKSIGIIYKLSNDGAPKSVLTQLYYSIAYPYINYNICSYGGTFNSHINRILLLQKRLIRIIHKKPFLEHTNPLFVESQILKIQDVFKLNIGLYMYDNSDITIPNRVHSYDTRNRNELLPDRARLTITQNSIYVAGPSLWNTIPEQIKNSPSRNSFKRQYKTYLLSQYAT